MCAFCFTTRNSTKELKKYAYCYLHGAAASIANSVVYGANSPICVWSSDPHRISMSGAVVMTITLC